MNPRFRLWHQGLDTAPMLADLAAHPMLWDAHPERRLAPGGAFAGQDDIWIRTRARDDLAEPDAFRRPFFPVFYPAWRALPSIRPAVMALMAQHGGTHLGNVLITRVRPRDAIGAHTDTGWAVEWFNRKFYIVLQGNARCVNTCLDEEVCMRTGEVWEFENRVEHAVENNGGTERISLIVTLRADG